MKMFLVPPTEIDSLWDDIKPLIDKSFNGIEDITADDLKEALKNSLMFVWVITEGPSVEAILLCEFFDYPRTKSCYVNAWATKSGYDFDKHYEFTLKELENFSKINGCEFLEAKTRKGLAKKLKSNGWEDKHSLVTKKLS